VTRRAIMNCKRPARHWKLLSTPTSSWTTRSVGFARTWSLRSTPAPVARAKVHSACSAPASAAACAANHRQALALTFPGL